MMSRVLLGCSSSPQPFSMFQILFLRTSEMPVEPIPACAWLLNKLTGLLQQAKMWPVKLSGIKHQEALSTLISLIQYDFMNLGYQP